MNSLIENVLDRLEYQHLDCVLHQPLKMLIRYPHKLNDEENRLVMNVLTHTDSSYTANLIKCHCWL